MLAELEQRAERYSGALASIYLGGGTPSLWRPDCIARAIAEIRRLGEPREVTIEANPTDCTDELLAAWRAAGINRISIGVQSLQPEELVTLGRDHRFGDGRAAIDRVLAPGSRSAPISFSAFRAERRRPRSSSSSTCDPITSRSTS